MNVLNAGLLKVLNLEKVLCKTIRRSLMLSKVSNCRNPYAGTRDWKRRLSQHNWTITFSCFLSVTTCWQQVRRLRRLPSWLGLLGIMQHGVYHSFSPHPSARGCAGNGWRGRASTQLSPLNLCRPQFAKGSCNSGSLLSGCRMLTCRGRVSREAGATAF